MQSKALSQRSEAIRLPLQLKQSSSFKFQVKDPIPSISRTHCQFLKLEDGRRLAYNLYGRKEGFPVFYFHSTGSSRLECALFDESANRLGYQLIAVDRPGIGRSDFKKRAQLLDICVDILSLADKLQLDRFGIMSFGTGGIFALTMAYQYPQRICFQLSLGGIPGNLAREASSRKSYTAGLSRSILPGFIRLFTRLKHGLSMETSGKYLERLQELLNYTDRKVLADPRILNILRISMEESGLQGFKGVAQDTGLSFEEPDFQLRQVSVPVSIWQGCADNLLSRSSGEYLAARIPSASFHSVANRGHFFFIHCMDEIFARTRLLTRAQQLAL